MLNLGALQLFHDLPKFIESLQLSESIVVLDLVPPAEEHKLFIIAFLVDPPPTGALERSCVRLQVLCCFSEQSIELSSLARLNKVSAYSENRCIKGNRRRGRRGLTNF